jgi:hypothetical protein
MTVDNLFEIAAEVSIKRHGRAMLTCETQRFREQTQGGFGNGSNDGNWPRVVFDDDFSARAHAGHQRSEIARRFSFGDMDHTLGHSLIIHRVGSLHRYGPYTVPKLRLWKGEVGRLRSRDGKG